MFLVGQGRSGTTLFQQMLDAHPELSMIRETFFMPRLIEDWRLLYRDGHLDTDAIVEATRGRLDELGLEPGEAKRRMDALVEPTPASVIRAICTGPAEREGKSAWGDKTPRYVMHIPTLARTFPDARFVHLTRDGRDVWLSYRDQGFGPTDLRTAAYEWNRRVGTGRKAGRRLGSERYREVRYEDLIEDPERVLRSVCSFIDLPFDDAMLRHHEVADSKLPPVEENPHHRRAREPVMRSPRDWRATLTDSQIRDYEATAGALLEDLGYERRFPGVMPIAWGKAWLVTRPKAVKQARGHLHLRTRIRRLLRSGPPTG